MSHTANTHQCTLCKKNRLGRFTRRKIASGRGWTKDRAPMWYCYTCLPKGEGSDEDDATPGLVKTPPAVIELVTPQKEQEKSLALVAPLETAVAALATDGATWEEEDYLTADALLGGVLAAKKAWETGPWQHIQDKTIKPIREGLEGLYELNRGIVKPLEALEASLKAGMRAFKVEEARLITAANQKRDDDAARLEQEIADAAAKQAAAATPQMRGKIAAKVEALKEQQAEVIQAAPTYAVTGSSSAVRRSKVPQVTDWTEFYEGCLQEKITLPIEVQTLIAAWLKKLHKADPGMVAKFPGVSLVDDINIAGR